MLFPRARIQSLVFLVFFYELIAVPSVIVLGFWFLLQLIDGVASLGLTDEAAAGIAFWAHIGGFLAGAALALPLRFVRPDQGPETVAAGGILPAGAPAAAPAAAPGPPPPPPRR